MLSRWALPLIVLCACASCGEREAPPVEPRTEEAPPPAPSAPSEAAPEPEAAPLPELGYAGAPPAIEGASRRALREALATHARGDHAASEAAFRALVEREPSLALARFDLACALARLGRLADARLEIERALALDYPEVAPRVDDDADLAELHASAEGPRLAATRARLEEGWRAALRRGAPITWTHHEGEAHVVRAGVWPGDGRFLPAGPRVSIDRGDHRQVDAVLVATTLDVELGVVIALSAESGAGEEGAEGLTDVTIHAWEAGTGRELAAPAHEAACRELVMHATPGGAAYSCDTLAAGPRTGAVGAAASYDAAHRPRLACWWGNCRTPHPRRELPVELDAARRATIHWASGDPSTTTLDPAHARHAGTHRSAWAVPDTGDAAWVLTLEDASPDRMVLFGAAAISRVTRARSERVLAGRGMAAIAPIPTGGWLLQVGTRVIPYRDGVGGEALPASLALEPGPWRSLDPDEYELLATDEDEE